MARCSGRGEVNTTLSPLVLRGRGVADCAFLTITSHKLLPMLMGDRLSKETRLALAVSIREGRNPTTSAINVVRSEL